MGQIKKDRFIYSIGGIIFSLESDFPVTAEKRFFTEGLSCPADRNDILSVRITSCLRAYSKIDKIFSLQRTNLYTTEEGYLQEFYSTDDKKDLLWTVAVNRTFSQFEYVLHPHQDGRVFPVTDPYGSVSGIFLLQHSFINRQGIIIHAVGGSIQGKGIAFAAPSGTGKSTLGRLLLHSPENRLFSEDRLIVRSMNDQWHLWGTPWYGEGDIARNESAPLAAFIFLRQSKKNKINKLSSSDGLPRLLQTVSIPWYSEEWTSKGLALCELLLRDIPVFEFAFMPNQTAVQAVERFAAEL